MLLVEAEATLAQIHGFLLIPYLAQTEGYFREIAPGVWPGCDTSAADLTQSRAILERHLAALS